MNDHDDRIFRLGFICCAVIVTVLFCITIFVLNALGM